jgi:hypothetical protein
MTAGHNQPPTQIEFTNETSGALGEWLKTHPVVQTEDEARDGKLLVDRAMGCLGDLEAERDGKVRPLNEQVRQINDTYRSPRTVLERILDELKDRLDAWRKAEEDRRREIADAARAAAEEAERIAREAEEREQEAKDDAQAGVETDIGPATTAADLAFTEYERATLALARANREIVVRIGGGFNRALSARTKEVLIITDIEKVIAETGWTERVLSAILIEAREYRKQHGRLPNGIISQKERRL